MTLIRKICRDQRGAALVEMAFALPVLIVMLWMIVQMGMVFRAMSGIQHALGEGARLATLFPQPTTTQIRQRINDRVFGVGPGTFNVPNPTTGTDAGGNPYLDLNVTYTQPTSLLLFPGPTITVARSKRVWIAT